MLGSSASSHGNDANVEEVGIDDPRAFRWQAICSQPSMGPEPDGSANGGCSTMKVEQLMTRNVETCHPGDSLSVAAHIMWDRDCGCVPVVEPEDGTARLVGMVTDRDVCMAAYTQGRKLAEIEVRGVMATKLFCCRSTDSIDDALKAMEENQLHRLPVVGKDGRLVGLISLADAAREAARERPRGSKKEVTDLRIAEVLEAISAPRGPHQICATA